jgi:single-strand DNA-binding protein
VVFGRTAEIARDYLRKGSKIYLEGRIQTRKWQDKNGQDQYTTEIVAQEFQMLDRAGGEGQPMGGRPSSQAPGRSNNDFDQSRGQPSDAGYPAAASGGGNDMDFDDDIPF